MISALTPVAGCGGTESRLNPDEPLATLPAPAVAQLCRYTIDVLAGQDEACLAVSERDFPACEAEPPWTGYETVRDWEDCVNARLDDACLAEPPCRP